MSWLLAFLGFATLIVLHEAGHFAAAKAVGMRVERFSLFFGPMLVRKRIGETEYGIGPIPLGGYVRISGMNPHEEIPPEHAHRSYFAQPVWKRIVVIAAGPFVNLVLAFLLIAGVYWASGIVQPSTKVDQVEKHAPASGKLQPGDRIVAIDGVRGGEQRLAQQIATHRCAGRLTKGCEATTPARVTVRRDGSLRTYTITPAYDPAAQKMRIGFAFGVDPVPVGPLRAGSLAGSAMWDFTSKTVSTIVQIFKPQERKQLSSVVGAYEVTRQQFQLSLANAFFLLGAVSLSLAIINLAPFLPLDGGHIFWALAEKVRRRPIPFSVMERAGVVGFALVIGLFVIGLSNDIDRLTGQGFGVR